MKQYIKIITAIIFLLFIINQTNLAQQVFINELMSSNSYVIADEDGEYSDWVEIFNAQDTAVNLQGYGLSDSKSSPFKWIFPSVIIEPKQHLLVFASDKNRTEYIGRWETVIDWGAVWKYRLGTSEPPAQWKNNGYDDQSWLSGKSGFGYGDNDDSTIISTSVNSVYVRKTFNVQDKNQIDAAVLHVDYDDAFVAYLNGVEIARANIGTVGIPPAYNQSATTYVEPQIIFGGKPKSYTIANIQSLLIDGQNVLAIQVHNYGTGSSDLTLIPFLSLGYSAAGNEESYVNKLLDLPFRYLHTNFKLSAEGESVVLTDKNSLTVDEITFTAIPPDVSYGRKPDGSEDWLLFNSPTPADSNTTEGYIGVTDNPIVTIPSGFYQGIVNITVQPGASGGTIYYTLDGSEPTEASAIYSNPILISSTKVLRVKAFNQRMIPSRAVTNTYLLNFSTQLPVFSLSTNPENFFDEENGIYSTGDSAETSYPFFGANFWKDWEKPIHVEYFENDGSKNGFSMDAGVQIFGGWTRGLPQKSLAIFARGRYGFSSIQYKLFPDLPFTEYQAFVLRNSGNDWNYTMFRDGLMTNIVDGVGIDKQDFKPTVVFLNGEYWGIYNLREKVNEHFLAQHHNLYPDSLDILENNGDLIQGDSTDYLSLLTFIQNNSLTNNSNYDFVKSKIDVENFIKYFVAEIYFANTDWPGNNIKFWRNHLNGKWRWILYDTDFGFGLFEPEAHKHNTLEFATEPNGPGWPNPPWSTFLLRKLLENESFKNDFINCFSDFYNTIFKAAVVNEKITHFKSLIEAEIPRQIQRWNAFNNTQWLSNIQKLRDFANQRLFYMQLHFIQKFGLTGVAPVNLAISDTSMGKIKINSLIIDKPSWTGSYFYGIPIKIIAQPNPGYRFLNWEGSNTTNLDTLTVTLNSAFNLKAVFGVDSSYTEPKIVFNEINYNSSLSFNTEDWIELYNNSDRDIDISGWIFKDSDDLHIYTFPNGTVIKENDYLVLCIDTTLFKTFYPDVKNFIGNTGFGLSGSGELIRLYNNEMKMMDSLVYDDNAPWPSEPDGNGHTLSLKNPDLDNSLGENWAASIGYGTPGRINDVFTDVEKIQNDLIPAEYSLEQNYPNPFNPTTKIRWQSPNNGWQSLKIYDMLGNEVITLVDEYKPAGRYEVVFDGSKLASGVYFYRLNTDKFTSTKKLILLK